MLLATADVPPRAVMCDDGQVPTSPAYIDLEPSCASFSCTPCGGVYLVCVVFPSTGANFLLLVYLPVCLDASVEQLILTTYL